MTIINHKAAKLRKVGYHYVTVPPEIIQVIKNPDSLAIWIYLQSQSEGWIISRTNICNNFGISRERYRKAIIILKEYGLVWSEPVKDENGRFGGRHMYCSNIPNHKLREDFEQNEMLVDANGNEQLAENEIVDANPTHTENTRKAQITDLPVFRKVQETERPVIEPLNKLSINNKLSTNNKRGGGGKHVDQFQPENVDPMAPIDDWILEYKLVKDLDFKNGIPQAFTLEQELPFKTYWIGTKAERREWNSVFVERVMIQWKKKGKQWSESSSPIFDDLGFK